MKKQHVFPHSNDYYLFYFRHTFICKDHMHRLFNTASLSIIKKIIHV